MSILYNIINHLHINTQLENCHLGRSLELQKSYPALVEFKQCVLKHVVGCIYNMTDIAKEAKKTEQDAEAKLKTEKDHAEGKPSSETLNKAKVKTEDALT